MKLNEIKAKLIAIGMNISLKGTAYIANAIQIYKPEMKITSKGGLYDIIAKANNDTASRVERAIRHSIEVLFIKVNAGEIAHRIKEQFGIETPVEDLGEKIKPTNSEFIAIMAFAVEYNKDKEK